MTGCGCQRWSYEGHGTALYVYRRSTVTKAKRMAERFDEAVAEAQEFSRRAEAATGNPAPNVEFTATGEGSVGVKATFKFKKHFSATNREN